MLRTLVLSAIVACSLAFPFPDGPLSAKTGFKHVARPRGVPQGKVFKKENPAVGNKIDIPVERQASESGRRQHIFHGPGSQQGHGFGGLQIPQGSQFHGSGLSPEDPRTIYVNVPPQQHPQPEPIVGGPPRKHYRIVFIRSPAPPPPQPILPPRVEQKTLIYVLHPKPNAQAPDVVEVPDIKHDPQVYFIHYDDYPPTSEDLQKLVKETIDGQVGSGGGYGGGPAPGPSPGPYAPPPQPNYSGSNARPTFQGPPRGAPSGPGYSGQPLGHNIVRARPEPHASRQIINGLPSFGSQQPNYHRTRSTKPEHSGSPKVGVASKGSKRQTRKTADVPNKVSNQPFRFETRKEQDLRRKAAATEKRLS